MERFRWIFAGALSAVACHLVAQTATPIDRALPFLAILVTVLAAASEAAILSGVPLLMLAEIALPDESLRLLVFGAILAACVGAAIFQSVATPPRRHRFGRALLHLPVVCIVLLRWIPLHEVRVARELLLLATGVLIFVVLDRTPFALMVAVAAVLFTPGVPLRTLLYPISILAVSVVLRTLGLPRISLAWPSSVAVLFAILFFPWSGVLARSFPYFLTASKPANLKVVVDQALAPRVSVDVEVPPDATSLVVSGANVAPFRRGMVLGTLEPGGRAIVIGDAADWGAFRRDSFHTAHNPLPRDAAGIIRGYGYGAWLSGAGRVPLPKGARHIRVVADAALPANASLQVEGIE